MLRGQRGELADLLEGRAGPVREREVGLMTAAQGGGGLKNFTIPKGTGRNWPRKGISSRSCVRGGLLLKREERGGRGKVFDPEKGWPHVELTRRESLENLLYHLKRGKKRGGRR